ncbi:hypothetical protein NDA16_005114 [Ustilago loliicola]|nr:hypothetical protein NDA16_005114 [Ustilago loliicola]
MAPTASTSAAAGAAQQSNGEASSMSAVQALKRRRALQQAQDDRPRYSYSDEEDQDEPSSSSSSFVPLKQRRLQQLQQIQSRARGGSGGLSNSKDEPEDEEQELPDNAPQRPQRSLLDEARMLREKQLAEQGEKTQAEIEAEEERKILEVHAARRKLASDMELAKGIQYTEPLTTSWTPPSYIRFRSQEDNEKLREKNHILADGLDIPPVITNFRDMKVPDCVISYLKEQKKIDFAEQSLIKPVIVNVGRAGAASLDIIQEVEYVKQEAKMVYLLECLQKTAPPVIIFSDNKNEVDDIQEYLLLKGVEAVAIHGSKTQDEREYAIRAFKSGQKDVMVASGVASKGLDFNEIQHVINYTMPKEIEDYVHQIGRTGRSGKTGIATTFVNANTQEQTLLDLKYLLIEAKQRIPPFLAAIEDPRMAATGGKLASCPVCGGLGHSIRDCPKLEENQRRQTAGFSRADDVGGY